MNPASTSKYARLSDREIITSVITKPYNEEAAAYLLYERYSPKFRKLCLDIYGTHEVYYDCVDDLFLFLKGNNLDWNKLRSLEWRSKFSTWIGTTASRRFNEIKPLLIGKLKNTFSIDGYTSPDRDREAYERRMRKVILMEAVGQLKDADQKFVILKTLEGYSSSEIALLLDQKWRKNGIVRYDNSGNAIVPSAGYVDVRRQRAKAELKRIIHDRLNGYENDNNKRNAGSIRRGQSLRCRA